MMRGKTRRISRVAERIACWLETITELSRHELARTELLDMDSGMRNDIESTKRTLLLLRELCVDIGGMFDSIGFHCRLIDHTQETFLAVVDQSCITATNLQRALEMHDARALALLQAMHDAERTGDVADTDTDTDADGANAPRQAAPYRGTVGTATDGLGAAAKA